jgi:hypothetical protein
MARKPAGPKGLKTLLYISCIVLLAGTVSPAFGGPTTSGAAAKALKSAKRALGLAKQADKRSKLALAKSGTPGPEGPRGPRGSEGFDGADGARGPAGAKGATGSQGAIGPAGADGATGPQGPIGLQGEIGPQGAPGPQGATGPAGQTASRSVTRTTPPLDIATEATVIDLAATHDGGSDSQITTSFSSRLMASASVQVRNPDASAREGRCALQFSDGTGPDNGLGDTSQAYAFDFPAQSDYDATVSLQRAVSKPAGTYNVRVSCWEAGGQPLNAIRADLSVFAAGG